MRPMKDFANQWRTIWIAVYYVGSTFGLMLLGSVANAEQRPNVILLYTDDQSFASTGVTGNAQVHTPHMDRLANEGVLFTRHYNSTSICMASRASVMTGMYEYKTGCNFGHGPMHPETFEQSYPVLLRDAGYRTGFGGKFGFPVSAGSSDSVGSYEFLPVDQFDAWAGGTGQTSYQTSKNQYLASYADRYPHSSRAYGAFAQDFVAECKTDQRPFCLTLFFKAPHRPFTPDPFFDDVYRDVQFERPSNYGRTAGKHLSLQARLGRQSLTFFRDMGFDSDHYQETMRKYHQLIHGVDYAIGMLRDALREHGVANNTVIILTSDNGFFCGSHGMGGKVLPYEEGSKVPLIIVDPREPGKGQQCDELTMTADIAPTILDLAGLQSPKQTDGISLVDFVRSPERTSDRQSIPLFQMWGAPTTYAMSVVTKTHKYIYWCCGRSMPPAEELFDLTSDPTEMINVVGEANQKAELEAMRSRYADQLSHLKQTAVPYNHYQPFGQLFDANITWEAKRDLVTEKMWKQYTSLPKQLGLREEDYFDFETVLKAAERSIDGRRK